MAFVRNGDIFVRNLSTGALTQLTRTDAGESRPQWGSDGALVWRAGNDWFRWTARSEEHTSELQSLMRISYAVFCLKKKKQLPTTITSHINNNEQRYENQNNE